VTSYPAPCLPKDAGRGLSRERRCGEVMFFRFPVTNTTPKRNRVRCRASRLRLAAHLIQ